MPALILIRGCGYGRIHRSLAWFLSAQFPAQPSASIHTNRFNRGHQRSHSGTRRVVSCFC